VPQVSLSPLPSILGTRVSLVRGWEAQQIWLMRTCRTDNILKKKKVERLERQVQVAQKWGGLAFILVTSRRETEPGFKAAGCMAQKERGLSIHGRRVLAQ
jgi:hypothetical protein